MFSNLHYDARVYETFKIVGEQTDNLHRRVKELETRVWFITHLMVLMTFFILCAMVLMRLDFEEANNKGVQFDNYLQGKVRLFEKRFLDLEYP